MTKVTVLDRLKEEGATIVDDSLDSYLDFVIRNKVQIEELENGTLSKGVKVAARNFLDNTFMDENGERGYWKKFLESDFQDLLINDREKSLPDIVEGIEFVCQHKQIISARAFGKRNEKGHHEQDFIIYCGECKSELFRISTEGREFLQMFRNQ